MVSTLRAHPRLPLNESEIWSIRTVAFQRAIVSITGVRQVAAVVESIRQECTSGLLIVQ